VQQHDAPPPQEIKEPETSPAVEPKPEGSGENQ